MIVVILVKKIFLLSQILFHVALMKSFSKPDCLKPLLALHLESRVYRFLLRRPRLEGGPAWARWAFLQSALRNAWLAFRYLARAQKRGRVGFINFLERFCWFLALATSFPGEKQDGNSPLCNSCNTLWLADLKDLSREEREAESEGGAGR